MASTNEERLSRIEAILESVAERQESLQASLKEAAVIAESNEQVVRALQAKSEQRKIKAKEERSRFEAEISEMKRLNRENVEQHLEFQQRFDQKLTEIQQIWQNLQQ